MNDVSILEAIAAKIEKARWTGEQRFEARRVAGYLAGLLRRVVAESEKGEETT